MNETPTAAEWLGLRHHEKTYLMIDGMNLYHALRALSFELDFRKLWDVFDRSSSLRRASYFNMISEQQNSSDNVVIKLVDYLEQNNWSVFTIPLMTINDGGRTRISGSALPMMAAQIVEDSHEADHLVIVSGDRALEHACELAKRHCRVTVISSTAEGTTASAEMRRVGDRYVDLVRIKSEIERERRPVSPNRLTMPARRQHVDE